MKKKKSKEGGRRVIGMNYPALKKKAILLGMPFPDAVAASIFDLISFIQKTNNKPNKENIDAFDKWREELLAKEGIKVDNRLRLGYLWDQSEQPKPKKEKVPKEKKPPREMDSNNLIKGTKKSYTFKLAQKGYSIERVMRRVLKFFPEASPKSIKIWYKKALNEKPKK